MKHADLPPRWLEKLKTYIRKELKQDRDRLGASDFRSTVVLNFPDGSFALFQYAFYILDPDHREVAVFTEHCGYHIFPLGDLKLERFKPDWSNNGQSLLTRHGDAL